jgi:anti-sigma regulatory factor (Ser/Thr protein kinase)
MTKPPAASTPPAPGPSQTPGPGHPHSLRLEMVSDPTYLSGAREMVAAVTRRLGFSEEGSGQIALAVDEALCNIIRHGYDRRTDRPIWLTLDPLAGANGKAEGVTIVLEDEAKQVDPVVIKSRDLDEIRPGGLGVHIIREIMDEVRYEKRDGAGMRLTMSKRIANVIAPGDSRRASACG